MVRYALSLAITAGFVCAAWADIAPPPPERGFKRVPCEHVVKLAQEIPGFKFYTFEEIGFSGVGATEMKLKPGAEAGVVVPGSSSASMRTGVAAVPVKVVAELKTEEELAKIFSRLNGELPAGVVVYDTNNDSRDLLEINPATKVENVITISPDEMAGVKFTAKETAVQPAKDATAEPSSSLSTPTIVAGIAGALAFITLGLWYFRRQ